MKKNILKKKLIISGVIILLICIGYFGINSYIKKNPFKEPDQQAENNKNIATDNNETQNTDDKKGEIEDKKITYEITNLNKKDGDFFSLPDEVTFTISPKVDKSKITLTNTEGTVLYTGETKNSEAKFTVYPGKVADGSQGTLLIEGYVGSEIVVFQKVKVVF